MTEQGCEKPKHQFIIDDGKNRYKETYYHYPKGTKIEVYDNGRQAVARVRIPIERDEQS